MWVCTFRVPLRVGDTAAHLRSALKHLLLAGGVGCRETSDVRDTLIPGTDGPTPARTAVGEWNLYTLHCMCVALQCMWYIVLRMQFIILHCMCVILYCTVCVSYCIALYVCTHLAVKVLRGMQLESFAHTYLAHFAQIATLMRTSP